MKKIIALFTFFCFSQISLLAQSPVKSIKSKITEIEMSKILNSEEALGLVDPNSRLFDSMMIIDPIELTSENYSSYLPMEIAAFSYAFSGAMGVGGEIEIVTAEGESYNLNYINGDLSDSQLNEIIPILPELKLPAFGETDQVPEGWRHISLGAGNNLLIRTKYVEQLLSAWEAYHKTEKGKIRILYNVWHPILRDILSNKNILL